ncbi:helix-turn-helix transcriptional regulator [Mucilaginibacter sp. UR6-1]|uniref:helix-turn-helix transcriptional regulator n=1 Tax=Mucilaginibacter sp. UR6-1 TaxID=1435643 RepID=UPI001E4DEB43|nr:helix-turn-helix transcriptional regulator [Mucilaginibacter sp. UR6-1]MCC8408044.1 helix-turn-helix transcriptional regulator [Mucilaginibacter sp. UR6-1]
MELTKPITDKINDFAPYAEMMPGVTIIHHITDFSVIYMCSKGQKLLGVTVQQLREMGTEYYPRYFNMEYMQGLLPKMEALLRDNKKNESFSYFQQVKFAEKNEWTWHITSTGIFMWDDEGKPLLTITVALPIENMKEVEPKAERLLHENIFLKNNAERFSSLSKREVGILKMVAKGKSSPDIAEELFISAETVQTHRRNIKQKLGISSSFEFTEYARAFNLI